MSLSQKGPSLTGMEEAEVFGVRNPYLFSFLLHPESSGGQAEAGGRTCVQHQGKLLHETYYKQLELVCKDNFLG